MNFKIKENIREFFNKHFFFLFLFLNYFTAFIFFGEFTLFYIDKLDNNIVFNHLIGKFYKGDANSVDLLLNGEVKIQWFLRLLQPLTLLYSFNTEFAFWTIDILTKLLSYFSFYIFFKKIN